MHISIDQSTSSTTVFLFDSKLTLLKKISKKHKQIQKKNGWVEHDAEEIYSNLINLIKKITTNIIYDNNFFISITNQRETFVVFDTFTGKPLYNAIVWQCRRGQNICKNILRSKYNSKKIKQVTGLEIDTYFPASKLSFLTKKNKKIKKKLNEGKALFGTIDTYLIYRLTKCNSYATDYTNASRSLFFDNKKLKWDNNLLKIFNLKLKKLPKVQESSSIFGYTDCEGILKNKIPIAGVIGDSQSSIFANQCFAKGDTKITLGTGASILTNIGNKYVIKNNLLTTLSFLTESFVIIPACVLSVLNTTKKTSPSIFVYLNFRLGMCMSPHWNLPEPQPCFVSTSTLRLCFSQIRSMPYAFGLSSKTGSSSSPSISFNFGGNNFFADSLV